MTDGELKKKKPVTVDCYLCGGTGDRPSRSAYLTALRQAHNWSQQELANRSGLTRSTIANIESDRSPITMSYAERFSLLLGVPMENFL